MSPAFLFDKVFKSLPITILHGPSEEPEDVRGSASHIKDEMHMYNDPR